MAFDVSGLSAYVQNNSKEIAVAAVTGASTAKLLISNNSVQSGLKGTAPILKMNADVAFQDASGCGARTVSGAITLTSATITVKQIKDCQNICPATLWNTYFSTMITKGQSPEESITPEFAKAIMDYRAEKVSSTIEQLLWQGDTTLTGSTNYKYIDGIKKQVGSGTALTATGSTITNKLQCAFLNVPVADRSSDDFRMFIGEDKYAEYTVDLANKNIYKPTDDYKLFGTSATLVPTPGLNGSNKLYAARISNLQLGLDGEGDSDKAELKYSIESEQWYQDFRFAVGVAVVRPTEVGVASI